MGAAVRIGARCRLARGVVPQQLLVSAAVLHGTRRHRIDLTTFCVMQTQQHSLTMAEDITGSIAQGIPMEGQRCFELELLLVPIVENFAEGGVLCEGGIETLGEGSVQFLVAGHLGHSFLPLLG